MGKSCTSIELQIPFLDMDAVVMVATFPGTSSVSLHCEPKAGQHVLLRGDMDARLCVESMAFIRELMQYSHLASSCPFRP